ncbi:MAG: CpsD/CapB family tyrosine-protein kinase [Clostridia bacterium]|nr:CpsD/CapB family tyrosine-protein kinase [Clostridia bacterium]
MSQDISKNRYAADFSIGKYRSDKRFNFNVKSATDHISNEAYKMLRTNLFFCGKDIKTVLVTSCMENDGKSTVSIELAKSLAEYGKKTLLIDADMRKSVLLHGSAYGSDINGLSETLSSLVSPVDVIFRTQNDDFDVLFSGHFPPNPVELIGAAFADLLEMLKQYYDYIIIDSPPLGMVIDAAVIASCCDGAILVINNNQIHRNMAIDVKEQLAKSGCKLLGAVLNNTKKGSEYKKGYYYSKGQYGKK